MSVVSTLREAAASIPDGALLTFGGFDLNRAPMALVAELARQGRRGLRLVGVPNPLPFDLLVGAGSASEAEFGFIGFQYEGGFVVAPGLRRAIEEGTITWRERDVYEIVQALRAAALGLPFLPAPGVEGSDYARVNRTPILRDPGTGEEVPVARAIRPDVALIHAQQADRQGNLWIADPYADDLLARASARVVATAEKIVERIDRPTIPGRLVDRLSVAEGGAFPTSCHGHYGYAADALSEYVGLAAEGRAAECLDRVAGGRPAAGRSPSPRAGRPAGPAGEEHDAARRPAIDRLVVGMARAIADGDVVTTGLASALPMLAVALAKASHAPRARYINCVGAVDPEIETASFTSVDVRLLERCAGTLALPELFDLARRGGIDLMFFGAAQVDQEARLNLTCIGDYARPKVKLPGPAGSSSMRPYIRKVIVSVPRHTKRSLVPRVDFATSIASPRNQETLVVTDRAVLKLAGGRLGLVSRHAGTSREVLLAQTGFDPAGEEGATTPEPTPGEMKALQKLDPAGIRYSLA